MEAVAKLKNVPTSPRKMRLVADLIRGQKVNMALSILKHEPKVGAAKLEKLLLSAISNWQNKFEEANLEDADLYVKSVWVDGGRILKRLRPAPQGRAHRIRKRSNHVTMIVASNAEIMAEPVVEEKAEKKEKVEKKTKAPKKEAKAKETKKEATAKSSAKAGAKAKKSTKKDNK